MSHCIPLKIDYRLEKAIHLYESIQCKVSAVRMINQSAHRQKSTRLLDKSFLSTFYPEIVDSLGSTMVLPFTLHVKVPHVTSGA